jgi:hypothetical protein
MYLSTGITRQIKSRTMRWAGHVARIGEERKLYKVLVEKHEGRRPLGKPRCRWENGIRMDVRETGWGLEWMQLAHDRDRWRAVVNTAMNLRVLAPRNWLRSISRLYLLWEQRLDEGLFEHCGGITL